MSDDEQMNDNNDEEYEFDYTDSDQSEDNVNIENQYYNSKALIDSDAKAALEGFDKVLEMQGEEKGEWGFKALKQIVKLYFRLERFGDMIERYKEQLTYIKSAVTRNYSEKCIMKILDYVSSSQKLELLQDFYETTLEALKDAKNERLWFKTNLKLGKLWLDMAEFNRLTKILKELHKSCQGEDGADDHKKGTQLLEVYALEIQMCTETKNNKKLQQLYQKAVQIKSAIPHPLIMGVIHECGGKMHMVEREWTPASNCFFDAFRNYDEAGYPRRIQCLKYLVLAKMLSLDSIDPFDSPEAKPYKTDPDILAMTSLLHAYQKKEIHEFERLLDSNRKTIMDDKFVKDYITDLLRNIRTQVLLKLIRPYTRIRIAFIATELNIHSAEVEELLVALILDAKVDGRIDQVNQMLELGDHCSGLKKAQAIDKWVTQLATLHTTVVNKLN